MRQTEQDVQFLNSLHTSIWTKTSPGWRYGDAGRSVESRKLTDAEWIEFVAVAHRSPCTLHNACFGFGVGLAVWSDPPFPGVPSEMLCFVTCDHLVEGPNGERGFKWGWKHFAPVALRESNIECTRILGLEVPRNDENHYNY